jgi:hypothetical protein
MGVTEVQSLAERESDLPPVLCFRFLAERKAVTSSCSTGSLDCNVAEATAAS